MPNIAITQRVTITTYGEKRDCLDQQWHKLLNHCDVQAFPVPNNPDWVRTALANKMFTGLILTGGNDLAQVGGDAPERDEVETLLLDHMLQYQLPVFAVCRGMQFLQSKYDIALEKVEGHVCPVQTIHIDGHVAQVNSYHNWGTRDNRRPFNIRAQATDGVIKAIDHVSLPVRAVMWHPERMTPFQDRDIRLIQDLFNPTNRA